MAAWGERWQTDGTSPPQPTPAHPGRNGGKPRGSGLGPLAAPCPPPVTPPSPGETAGNREGPASDPWPPHPHPDAINLSSILNPGHDSGYGIANNLSVYDCAIAHHELCVCTRLVRCTIISVLQKTLHPVKQILSVSEKLRCKIWALFNPLVWKPLVSRILKNINKVNTLGNQLIKQ